MGEYPGLYVLTPTKSAFSGARRAGLAGLGVASRGGPALPKSAETGNLSLDKAVIRWTSGGGSGGASARHCNSLFNSLRPAAGREKVFE
ncbi:MAG: hypothetical protein ACREDM_16925 [Methylocella sp.]